MSLTTFYKKYNQERTCSYSKYVKIKREKCEAAFLWNLRVSKELHICYSK